jgi:hypothetical protein
MCTEKHPPQDSNDDHERAGQSNNSNNSFPDLLLDTELSTLDPKVLAAINKRIAAYRKRFPQGEPMYKRVAPYRLFIYAEDIVLMTKKSLRTAHRVLQNTRIYWRKSQTPMSPLPSFAPSMTGTKKRHRNF